MALAEDRLVGPGAAYTSISLGNMNMCAIKASDDTADCWGAHLPDNLPVPWTTPYASISVGQTCLCALKLSDNLPDCFGKNQMGQCVPPPNTQYSSISIAHFHGCAIKLSDDTAECWGDSNQNSASPKLIAGGTVPNGSVSTAYSAIGTGQSHTCAMMT